MASPKRILIVDDEEDIRTYLSTLLGDQGFQTIQATDGEAAKQIILTELPDLITLDISMPEKSGVRFFREIKTDDRWKHIPVIIVTGVSEDFRSFISSRHQIPPPEGFVPKPISQQEKLTLVRKFTKAKDAAHGILYFIVHLPCRAHPCIGTSCLQAVLPPAPCPLGNLSRPA